MKSPPFSNVVLLVAAVATAQVHAKMREFNLTGYRGTTGSGGIHPGAEISCPEVDNYCVFKGQFRYEKVGDDGWATEEIQRFTDIGFEHTYHWLKPGVEWFGVDCRKDECLAVCDEACDCKAGDMNAGGTFVGSTEDCQVSADNLDYNIITPTEFVTYETSVRKPEYIQTDCNQDGNMFSYCETVIPDGYGHFVFFRYPGPGVTEFSNCETDPGKCLVQCDPGCLCVDQLSDNDPNVTGQDCTVNNMITNAPTLYTSPKDKSYMYNVSMYRRVGDAFTADAPGVVLTCPSVDNYCAVSGDFETRGYEPGFFAKDELNRFITTGYDTTFRWLNASAQIRYRACKSDECIVVCDTVCTVEGGILDWSVNHFDKREDVAVMKVLDETIPLPEEMISYISNSTLPGFLRTDCVGGGDRVFSKCNIKSYDEEGFGDYSVERAFGVFRDFTECSDGSCLIECAPRCVCVESDAKFKSFNTPCEVYDTTPPSSAIAILNVLFPFAMIMIGMASGFY